MSNQEYIVEVENFSGPLDLLLHLIKKKNMDLMDLDVSVICDQYLAYIETMDASLLEEVSEYLVMASWLIEMKSRLLLPKEETIDEEDDYEAQKQKMIRRLIEKNQINQVLDSFEEAYENREKMVSREAMVLDFLIEEKDEIPDDLEVYDLIEAMQKVLKRNKLLNPLESKITKVEISIDERCDQIKHYFLSQKDKEVDFETLFDEGNKYFAIVTFLSILTLVKQNYLIIKQDKNFDKIYLKGVYREI